MTIAQISILDVITLSWLTGPIFDKELRVASRRRRFYALRTGYLLILLFTVVGTFLSYGLQRTGTSGSAMRALLTGETGRQVILSLAWLQFGAMQLLAIVLMCNALCDEIQRGTQPSPTLDSRTVIRESHYIGDLDVGGSDEGIQDGHRLVGQVETADIERRALWRRQPHIVNPAHVVR